MSVRSADAHGPCARAFRVARAARRLHSRAVCHCRLCVIDFCSCACFVRSADRGRVHGLMARFDEAFRHGGSRSRVARAPHHSTALAACMWVPCVNDFRWRALFCRCGSILLLAMQLMGARGGNDGACGFATEYRFACELGCALTYVQHESPEQDVSPACRVHDQGAW